VFGGGRGGAGGWGCADGVINEIFICLLLETGMGGGEGIEITTEKKDAGNTQNHQKESGSKQKKDTITRTSPVLHPTRSNHYKNWNP